MYGSSTNVSQYRRSWSQVTGRLVQIGATVEAIALTGFALARSAPQAAAANAVICAAYTLHHGGWSANLLEVGGKDTPVMNAFSNILNNFPVRYATQQCRGMESICAPLQKSKTRRPVPVLHRLI